MHKHHHHRHHNRPRHEPARPPQPRGDRPGPPHRDRPPRGPAPARVRGPMSEVVVLHERAAADAARAQGAEPRISPMAMLDAGWPREILNFYGRMVTRRTAIRLAMRLGWDGAIEKALQTTVHWTGPVEPEAEDDAYEALAHLENEVPPFVPLPEGAQEHLDAIAREGTTDTAQDQAVPEAA